MKSFIDRVRSGESEIDDIDDFVELWHTGTSNKTLGEILGMSIPEYCAWVLNSNSLSKIIDSRKSNC